MKKLLLTLTILATACSVKQAEKIAIIPQPVSIIIDTTGEPFTLTSEVTVTHDNNAQILEAANFIASNIAEHIDASQPLKVTDSKSSNAINLTLWSDAPKPESYKLKVTNDSINIQASDYSGAVYAMQTLLQLMHPDVYSKTQDAYAISNVEIIDYPRFKWRGMHLDCSRHFFTADSVKRYIDYLALHKFNTFHWHFTDDHGWRMESKKHPLLTEKAAWRVDRRGELWDGRKPIDRAAGETADYGGFYTQEEIKDIVSYAKARGVVVIPEIEIPGHTSAVFAAYPELSCLGKSQEVIPGGYYPEDIATCFCAGNEEVFTFLEDILGETIELFPNAPYIHIGGDEVAKRFWENCDKCKRRMKQEGLKNVDELQSYFIKRIETYINSKGRPIIGWDEILEGGLAPNATVMSWQGIAGGIEAARQGHDVVMTPASHLYFDYYQNDPAVEPRAIGGYITTRHVYDYEPVPDVLTEKEAKHIIGAQANLWSEFIPYFDHVEYMVLPRMSALAEVVWSPKETRNWDDFSERLDFHNKRLKTMGANYHKGTTQLDFETEYNKKNNVFYVTLISELYGSDIFYTTDGSEPTLQSTQYTTPIAIDTTTNIKAIVVKDGEVLSKKATSRTIGMHKAVGKTITYNIPPAEAYKATVTTLNDGFTGGIAHNDGYFQGFNNKDFNVTIDLGEITEFNNVTGSFLQSAGAWVYLPAELIIEISNDNKTFRKIGSTSHNIDAIDIPTKRHAMSVDFDTQAKARYVRVVGKNRVTPSGLPGAGTVNWIFADEIFIN